MKLKFKILIAFVLLVSISSIIFNFENTLASAALVTASYTQALLIFLIIPILIILYILKSKEKITNDIIKLIFKGIGLLSLGLIVLAITAGGFQDELTTDVLSDEYFRTEELENQDKNIQQSLPTRISQIVPSKMGNGWYQTNEQEAYYDHAEKILEKYVLSYKGQDNAGLDIQDLTIVVLTEQCGFGVMLEKYNTEMWVSVSDELDDNSKLAVMLMTSSDIPCANNLTYYFDVHLNSGKITAESNSIREAGLLSVLDDFD